MRTDEAINSARKLHHAGRLDEAEKIYRQILARQPDHAETLQLLGALTGQRGNLDGAIDLIRQSLQSQPNSAEAHRNLAVLLVRRGMAEEALTSFRRAAELRNDWPQSHLDLGKMLLQMGRGAEAASALGKAVALNSANPEAHTLLGDALVLDGRHEEALAAYQRAAELHPIMAELHVRVGNALAKLGRTPEAIGAFSQAIRLKPELASAHASIGHAYRAMSQFEEALEAYRRAAQIRPDYFEAVVSMALTLAHLQRFDEALEAQARAAELKPNDGMTHEALGEIYLRCRGAEAAIEHFRRAVEVAPMLLSAWSSLGLALQAMGRFDEAEGCFRKMLEIKPDLAMAHKHLVSATRMKASHEQIAPLLKLLSQPGLSDEQRVTAEFALGTALDDAGLYDEAFEHFASANALVKRRRESVGEKYDGPAFAREVEEMIQTYTREFFEQRRHWGEESELPVFIVGMPRSGTTLVHQIAASHPLVHGAGELNNLAQVAESLDAAGEEFKEPSIYPPRVRDAAWEYLWRLGALQPGAARVLDKMPGNLHLVAQIALMFPRARVILCRRDARDTCLSCYFQGFASGNIFSFDLRDCGHYHVQNMRLMDHWLKAQPLRMLEVHYEDVTRDLEGQSRRLIDFLGLDWDSRCLEFHQAKTTVLTSSVWQVRQPIYQQSVGRWRHYESHLGPLIEALGNENTKR